jgi:hypothetical protein
MGIPWMGAQQTDRHIISWSSCLYCETSTGSVFNLPSPCVLDYNWLCWQCLVYVYCYSGRFSGDPPVLLPRCCSYMEHISFCSNVISYLPDNPSLYSYKQYCISLVPPALWNACGHQLKLSRTAGLVDYPHPHHFMSSYRWPQKRRSYLSGSRTTHIPQQMTSTHGDRGV